MGRQQRLELTWTNKDKALIPTEQGRYGYTWVDPRDPRYCETRVLTVDETVTGTRSEKEEGTTYSQRADLELQADNLLILGESGDVLEALTRVPEWSEKYVGKVKCIYIDPPFNTAQTFANYEDNLEHSVWLTMMRDRLLHMRDLLSNDGSIWVHLDDVENHRMRSLMDEVFGSGSFVAEVTWEKTYGGKNDSSKFIHNTDVVLVYAGPSFSLNGLPRTDEMNARYSNPDSDARGLWKGDNAFAPGASTHPGMVYGIQHPVTGELVYPRSNSHWVYGAQKMLEIMREWGDYQFSGQSPESQETRCRLIGKELAIEQPAEDILWNGWTAEKGVARYQEGGWPLYYPTKNGMGGFNLKRYLIDMADKRPPTTLWTHQDVGHSDNAKKRLKRCSHLSHPSPPPNLSAY